MDAVDQTAMEVEPMLSNELLDELGAESTDVLILSGKKKKKQKREEPGEEVKLLAKQMSKKAKKRVEQIKSRKEKELKRSDFLETIKKNQISDSHRQLLVSTRDIGQTLTMKQLLSNIKKKQSAGLELTTEEHDLLFKPDHQGPAIDTNDYNLLFGQNGESVEGVCVKINSNNDVDNGGVLFSMNDLMAPTVEIPSRTNQNVSIKTVRKTSASEEKKEVHQKEEEEEEKGEKKKKVENDKKSIGFNLLQQFAKLKEKNEEKLENEETIPTLIELNPPDETYKPLANPSKTPYIPHELSTPVTNAGEILPNFNLNQPSSTGGDNHQNGDDLRGVIRRRWKEVKRPSDVSVSRLELPVTQAEQEIVEAVRAHDVVVLCGATGSGKSTQVPQFLYEAGFTDPILSSGLETHFQTPSPFSEPIIPNNPLNRIGITQPRRVAVTSTASRVAYEMGHPLNRKTGNPLEKENEIEEEVQIKNERNKGNLVGYHIRFDSSTVGEKTEIKFMTDGILLREATHDILLRQYNVLIIDEAHERNVNSDVLLGLLSRALPLRNETARRERERWLGLSAGDRSQYALPLSPLKLIIMSATLRVDDFLSPRLFASPPPVLQVEARQYPVTIHFSRRTELQEYLEETRKKVTQIHQKLPQGTVLVFLTGKREILLMCKMLERSLNKQENRRDNKVLTGFNQEGSVAEEGLNGVQEGKKDIVASRLKPIRVSKKNVKSNIRSLFNSSFEIDSLNKINENSEKSEKVVLTEELFNLDDDDDDDEKKSDFIDLPENDENDGLESESGELQRNMLRKALQHNFIGKIDETEQMKEKTENEMETENTFETENQNTVETENQNKVETENETETEIVEPPLKAVVLPLYAMMPQKLQSRIFEPPPPGHRLIVVATNVAETSITIPGVRYVVDCGRQKEKVQYNEQSSGTGSGVIRFEVQWISQASAEQRAGRAGRTGPGHCYRLYSANFFHQHLRPFQPPEISVTPLEGLILQMKGMGINHVEGFPFPSSPPTSAIRAAHSLLTMLGAVTSSDSTDQSKTLLMSIKSTKNLEKQQKLVELEQKRKEIESNKLTNSGKILAGFPLNPRYSKMLVAAMCLNTGNETEIKKFSGKARKIEKLKLLSHTLTLVATLAEKSVFMELERKRSGKKRKKTGKKGKLENHAQKDSEEESSAEDSSEDEIISKTEKEAETENFKKLFYHPDGDGLARLRATGAYLYTANKEKNNKNDKYSKNISILCKTHNLHQPTLQRVSALRNQLLHILLNSTSGSSYINDTEEKNQIFNLFTFLVSDLEPGEVALALAPTGGPPTEGEEISLRQLLVTSFPDCLVRKVPMHQLQKDGFCGVKPGDKGENKGISIRRRMTAYYSCNPDVHKQTGPLYLHPNSNLFRKDPTSPLPEYLIYCGPLLKNQKGDCTYMTCVNPVLPQWVPLLTGPLPLDQKEDSGEPSIGGCPLLQWGVPLLSPGPFFDVSADEVMSFVVPNYGIHQWELPVTQRRMRDLVGSKGESAGFNSNLPLGFRRQDEVYRWFGRFLLEGAVGLSENNKKRFKIHVLQSTTSKVFKMISTSWLKKEKLKDKSAAAITDLKPLPKVSNLLQKLVKENIFNVRTLIAQLLKNPGFLTDEITPFLTMNAQKELLAL